MEAFSGTSLSVDMACDSSPCSLITAKAVVSRYIGTEGALGIVSGFFEFSAFVAMKRSLPFAPTDSITIDVNYPILKQNPAMKDFCALAGPYGLC